MNELVMLQSVRSAITIALGIYLALDLWRLNRAGPAFAVQKFQINLDNPRRLVVLEGRQTGLLGWLYTRLGLEGVARFELSSDDVRIERHSLKGFDVFYAPVHDLSCSSCGYYRAISLVLIAVSLVVGGYFELLTASRIDNPYQRQDALAIAGTTALVGSIAATIAYLLFELSKRITVVVETKGGAKMGIALKRNVLENITVGIDESLQAVDVLNRVVLNANTPVKFSSLAETVPMGGAR